MKNNCHAVLEKLRIFVYNVLCNAISIGKGKRMKGYLSIREISYKWGVSERRVNQYCTQGRIPEDAEKPTDPRKGNSDRSHTPKEE